MFDFYLSEISVSDNHGGGLTLQRVLGAELDAVSLFAHLGLNAQEYPATERLRPRCLDLPSMWLRTPAAGQWLGFRPSYWLRERPIFNRWNARKLAAKICAHLPAQKRPLQALVCPQHAHSLYVTEALRYRHPLEYVTWVMDDHLVRWRDRRWCYPPNIEALFARHLLHARVVFVISPVMADFYRTRFGVESQVLFGPVDAPTGPAPEPRPCSDGLHLAYFGAVTEWQLDALALLAQNLAAPRATLDIFTGLAELPAVLKCAGVRLRGRLPATQVLGTMRQYHAVVLPISFLPELRQMSELNIATKMSECLASGIPTLAVGPAYAAMVGFLKKHVAALCVTHSSCEAMQSGLTQLRDVELRRALAGAARRVAREQLSTQAMREVWSQGVAELASPQKINS